MFKLEYDQFSFRWMLINSENLSSIGNTNKGSLHSRNLISTVNHDQHTTKTSRLQAIALIKSNSYTNSYTQSQLHQCSGPLSSRAILIITQISLLYNNKAVPLGFQLCQQCIHLLYCSTYRYLIHIYQVEGNNPKRFTTR